jgi:hypothetical protein
MKTIIIILAVLFMAMAGSAQAQTWTTANQITVAWDAVTVPSGTVSYRVYSKPETSSLETLMTTTSATQATLTFTTEGRYFLGVLTVRTLNGVEVDASRIAWSNVATDVQAGVTFGVQYIVRPADTKNIRIPQN